MDALATPTIEQAVLALKAVCDGASTHDQRGFNGWDAKFVADLLRGKAQYGTWTLGQQRALHKMLRKYTKQLATLGIDYELIPTPAEPAPAPAAAPAGPGNLETSITMRADGKIVIRFPFDKDVVELVRQIPGRTWNGPDKSWLVPSDALGVEGVFRFAEQVGIQAPTDMLAAYEEAKVARAEAEKKAMAAMADSMAIDANFHVDGLGGSLMPFQRAGVKYATEKKRCLIADEMGLGKTVQALATAKFLDIFPLLVICPASLKLNWHREARKWLPGKIPTLFESNRFGEIAIMSYELVPKWVDWLTEKKRFKGVIFDEAHYLKNHKAQRSIAARTVAQSIRKEYRDMAMVLALTGTPVLNRPAEMLHLLQVLGRLDDVGGFKVFQDRYLKGGFQGNGSNLEELQQIARSRFLIRREKMQVLTDLPAKRRVEVDITMEDPKAYMAVENAPLEDNGAAALVRIGELRREAARQKLAGTIDWVKEFLDTDKKLILFAVHRDVQAQLVQAFPGCAHILGDDETGTRQAAVDRFQEDPTCKLVVCSLAAAGVGLTLTAASDVAFLEFGWTPGAMDQAEDRAHRIGQKDSVTAWYLRGVGAGIDTNMLDLISSKREVGSQLLDANRTSSADQNQVKNQLVKTILGEARKAGRIKKES